MPVAGSLRGVRRGVRSRCSIVPGAVGAVHRHSLDGSGKGGGPGLGPRDPYGIDRARRRRGARSLGDPRLLRAVVRDREVRGRRVPDLARDPGAPRARARSVPERHRSGNTPSQRIYAQGVVVNVLNPEDGVVLPRVPAAVRRRVEGSVPLQAVLLGVTFILLGFISDGTLRAGLGSRLTGDGDPPAIGRPCAAGFPVSR